jgi:DNA-binding NarL/FixJ family response regulator
MDFGLAIGADAKRLTAQGTIIGTPAYLSPEQAQGFALSYSTDIYTAGVVLYELLVGELPFDADDITSILLQHVKKPPVPPSEMMNAPVPEELERALLKALEKKPENRFTTAADMAVALGHILETAPMPAVNLTDTLSSGTHEAVNYVEEINVILADDHVVLRQSLAFFLNDCKAINVLDQASDGDEAYELVKKYEPDVLILDLNMPRTNGLAILPRLRQDFPDVKILILTGRDENVYIMKALRAGASGYVLKTIEEKDLELAVHDIAAGNMVLGHGVAEKVIAGLSEFDGDEIPLNAIELDVLLCIAAGLDKAETAERLGMDTDEITGHMIHIIDTLKVKSETDAALMALRANWISLDKVHGF